ncbi:hypothetical protein KA001_00160 [Patescibacteria group bacterium]|nr:hypothetical protein [Patescibacteria group bacterium]
MLIGNDLALHNFSLVNFFVESLDFLITVESTFITKPTFFTFLKFYFKSSFFDDLSMFKLKCPPEIDSKILDHDIAKMSKLKKLIFLYKLQ